MSKRRPYTTDSPLAIQTGYADAAVFCGCGHILCRDKVCINGENEEAYIIVYCTNNKCRRYGYKYKHYLRHVALEPAP